MKRGKYVWLFVIALFFAFISLFAISNEKIKATDITPPSIICNRGDDKLTLSTTTTYYKYGCMTMTFEDDEGLASFTVSGDHSAGWEISGTSYTYHSYPYLFNEGSYTITVTDAEGNVATGYIIIDQTEPVVSCGSNTIYDTDFVYFKSCTLSFSDNSSIKSTYIYKYKNTGANLELVSTNVNGYTLSEEGHYSIHAWDIADNSTVANIAIDTTSPVWHAQGYGGYDMISSGNSITVYLEDATDASGRGGTLCDDCNIDNYKFGWSTSSTTFTGTYSNDIEEWSNRIELNVYAPIVSASKTYYLWIYNTGADMAGNIPTYSSNKVPYSIGPTSNDYLIYKYIITPPKFNSLFSKASLSEGRITYTFNSSNIFKTTYESGTVTYFLGQSDYTDLDEAFSKFGVTVDTTEFFENSLISPQGLAGDICLYIRIESDDLATFNFQSPAMTINDSETSTVKYFTIEENQVEQITKEPIALTVSNIVAKENTRKNNSFLFVSMILISSMLAIEVIIIRKHQKAHN